MTLQFDASRLQAGDILHVRGYGVFAILIRWALNIWAKRAAKKAGVPPQPVWGNHDGLLCYDQQAHVWLVGEALAHRGNTLTPLSVYEAQASSQICFLRVYRVIGVTIDQGREAQERWYDIVYGTRYDFPAFIRLIWKSLVCDFAESKWRILRWIGESAAGWTWRNWCTEGVGVAWNFEPVEDVFQTENPTPMTTEQVAGQVWQNPKRKIRLKDITAEVQIRRRE